LWKRRREEKGREEKRREEVNPKLKVPYFFSSIGGASSDRA